MNHQDTKAPRSRRVEEIPARTNEIAREIVDASYKVHSTLGPGLLETVYETCLAHELGMRGLRVARQIEVPVVYEGKRLQTGFRLDLLVENSVVIELKAADALLPVHKAQLLTYLKLTGHRLGLLINFNVPLIKNGIVRLAL